MSGIRSILLHLDATPASTTRLALAHALAERCDARVTALFGVGAGDAAAGAFAYSASAALVAAEERAFAHEPARRRLREQFASGESECLWCDVAGASLIHGIVAESAYADLLILGQQRAVDTLGAAPPGFVESVILGSGTPAIVVPYPHRQETIGNCILVAWNGSAQSARALRAALPLMDRAAQVHIAIWADHEPVAPFSRLDVAGWLQRHDVAATLHRHPSETRVAEELSELATRLGADLVVMGCYGRSRAREWAFGGVTRSALASLSIPVLMAH